MGASCSSWCPVASVAVSSSTGLNFACKLRDARHKSALQKAFAMTTGFKILARLQSSTGVPIGLSP